ncbi:MAG: hypothetical protein IJO57_01210 [Bacilli bacterium]|nr:hypothetical protein [Bacilli bacterium]
MREAVGSTFLFKLMIFFIFFFASFLAIAINYSQAFRIKNQIINILEQYEGYGDASREKIWEIIGSSGYYRVHDCINNSKKLEGQNVIAKNDAGAETEMNGICIYGKNTGPESKYKVYKVTTYVSFEFPIIGNVFSIPVVGETKAITNPVDDGVNWESCKTATGC